MKYEVFNWKRNFTIKLLPFVTTEAIHVFHHIHGNLSLLRIWKERHTCGLDTCFWCIWSILWTLTYLLDVVNTCWINPNYAHCENKNLLLKTTSPIFSKLFEILVSQESSYFSHNHGKFHSWKVFCLEHVNSLFQYSHRWRFKYHWQEWRLTHHHLCQWLCEISVCNTKFDTNITI